MTRPFVALAGVAVTAAAVALHAQTASSLLLVLNKEEAALVIVDPASRKILGRVSTGEGPHEMTVSSDGKLAFVGNYGTAQTPGSTISVSGLTPAIRMDYN